MSSPQSSDCPENVKTVAYSFPTIHPTESAPFAGIASAGNQFGNYELLGEIGRGGMGVVFKARQIGLNRLVALKMILPGSLSSEEDVDRFRAEAEAAARLNHPNIVTVHEVGTCNGQHFYSMDFIDGPSLAQRLANGPLPSRMAARYLLGIAQAIHHAHKQKILHRDLKPSNILLDRDDQPHVADFGLAKKLGDTGKTRTGSILGTPSYMAPEQAAGKVRELGPACDVYGLGALLYELLTGRPPFRSETPLDTIMQVLEREPVPPRLLNAKIDRDLEKICLKCLEKDPRSRYPAAEALVLDLQRYLNGESVSASGFNVLDRLTRTLDRGQYDFEFRSWGNMLLIFAGIVLAEHLTVFTLTMELPRYPLLWIVLARTIQFTLMGLVFWRYRKARVMPASTAERQLWSIWLGYLVSCLIVSAVGHLVVHGASAHDERSSFPQPQVVGGPEHGHDAAAYDERSSFPYWAILTGLAFFVMGSNYWGRCYLYGAAFFLISVVMALNRRFAPIEFGMLWTTCLIDLGLRLRRLGGDDNFSSEHQGGSGVT